MIEFTQREYELLLEAVYSLTNEYVDSTRKELNSLYDKIEHQRQIELLKEVLK